MEVDAGAGAEEAEEAGRMPGLMLRPTPNGATRLVGEGDRGGTMEDAGKPFLIRCEMLKPDGTVEERLTDTAAVSLEAGEYVG